MSQELAEQVFVQTSSGFADSREGPFHSFYLYGDNAAHPFLTRPLHEATEEIYKITHDAHQFDEGVMRSIRDYVVNLNRVTDSEDDGYGFPVEHFEPSSVAESNLRAARQAGSSEPIVLLETPLDSKGFAIFVGYVMTNTKLHAEDRERKGEDPRIAMIEKFRTQSGPVVEQPAVQ